MSAHIASDDPASVHRLRALIVDDEALGAVLCRILLENLGVRDCEVAFGPADALELARATAPDLLLMDVNLGAGRSGVDLAEEIYRARPCRVVFVTGYSLDRVLLAEVARIPGAIAIEKPVSLAALRSALDHAHHLPLGGQDDVISLERRAY